MRWPGADTGVAVFPGPDVGTTRFPGVDAGVAAFPPAPAFAKVIDLMLAGGGVVSLVLIDTPVYPLALAGGGVFDLVWSSTSTIPLALSGSGIVDVEFGTPIVVQLLGDGVALVDLTPSATVPLVLAGGGTAVVTLAPSATVPLVIAGGGTAVVTLAPSATVPLVITGGGVFDLVWSSTSTIPLALTGTATADVTLAAASTWQGAPQRVGTPVMASSTTHQVAINYPDASAPGDLILLLAQYGRTTGTSANDWSATGPAWGVVSTQNMESSSLFATVLWAIRGEETSVTVSVSPTANPRAVEVYAVAYDGATVHLTAPIGPVSSNGAVASTAITSTALSSVDADSELLGLYWGWRSGSTTAWSTTWSGGSFTKRDEQQIGLSTYRVLSSMGTMVQATAGTSPAVTVTRSSSVAARGLTVVAIRPAKST